ncbi:UNVERIFIED_CONTAM: hypothetical protein GTU68_043153 [Idotea baltica]|nr:hypothetical protein [Idotea baltica]
MLVLTRKEQEEIYIGNNITIKVVSTGNGRVKIGIDAPNDVRIIRGEILEQFASESIPAKSSTVKEVTRKPKAELVSA